METELTRIDRDALNQALLDPQLAVMNFLNEVKLRYPEAISFSAGRPAEDFFDVPATLAAVNRFVSDEAAARNCTPDAVYRDLGQYGRTNGMIGHHLAKHLAKDEQIHVDPEHIVVTNGCQEAMALVLITLLRGPDDVLLTADPTYIGITGLAALLGITVAPVRCGEDGLDLDDLAATTRRLRAQGKQPRAVYVIPDYNNPLGSEMTHRRRRDLLACSETLDLLILEDNPYGMFCYDGEPLPTLKSMDRQHRVIYLGTFSKTLFPSLRIGYLVSDAMVSSRAGTALCLTQNLSMVKSLTSVNTSPLNQAMVAGVLLECDHALRDRVAPARDFYRTNRDCMLAALAQHIPAHDSLREQVQWNQPRGGFFMRMTLPFPCDESWLQACAAEAGVIVVPMAYFALAPGHENQIRLSFCSNTPDEIERGIAALVAFIRATLD
ncbi:aminotransferase-like domain-containing protein [Acanthopleuribacter pedis]|uniref:PLP-dependent aminotransferase family protein n=1 Tax=Acanthopleuribacter pedis TaxID=442870 RepID=A0A8J7QBC9_9BACT|nr:PLP-dependent aminotransferase family protein [Acanthopleuribacter pedis]MBO1317786.1 PLP-dependent aminotransferase family protein [Acanthopleuribacter pedis]